MMKKLFICAAFALASFILNAQTVEGTWKLADGSAIVDVQPQGEVYNATIIWLDESLDKNGEPKKDTNNPKEELRSRQVLGLNILSDLKFDGKRYSGGSIYDPGNGKTYRCTMEIDPKDPTILIVKGYVGPFNRAMRWNRITEMPAE